MRPKLADNRFVVGKDVLWKSHIAIIRLCSRRRRSLPHRRRTKRNPEKASAEAFTLSGLSTWSNLAAQPRYQPEPKSQLADPSEPVRPNHWGSSPDFPCGAAALPCGLAARPDPGIPLQGPASLLRFPASTTNKEDRTRRALRSSQNDPLISRAIRMFREEVPEGHRATARHAGSPLL